LHPHQTHLVVHEDWVVPLPKGVDPARAVLSANLETALNATWDAEPRPGERTVVFGGGVVGLLTAWMVGKNTGTNPVIVDINRDRKPVAERLGLAFMHPDDLGAHEFDCLFNTTASAAGLQCAIDHAAFEGRIIEMSWYGSKEISLSLGGSFHSRRLTIISSQVGHVAPSHRTTTSHRERMQLAMSHLSDANLDVLLTPRVLFDDLPKHLDKIFAPGADVLCPLVGYTPTET
ncbi:MAG: zinc-binding alcohol dehydrogenase, partial [Pseudomonadota bacterium]